MAIIRINMNLIKSENGKMPSNISEIQSISNKVLSVRNSIASDVSARYDISGRLSRIINRIDKVNVRMKNVYDFVETSMNIYAYTENQLLNEAEYILNSKK